MTLAPVVADSVSENVAASVEGGCRYGTANERVTLETMLSVLVPISLSVNHLERVCGCKFTRSGMFRQNRRWRRCRKQDGSLSS